MCRIGAGLDAARLDGARITNGKTRRRDMAVPAQVFGSSSETQAAARNVDLGVHFGGVADVRARHRPETQTAPRNVDFGVHFGSVADARIHKRRRARKRFVRM